MKAAGTTSSLYKEYFREHAECIAASQDLLCDQMTRVVALAAEAVKAGGKLVFFGNGGSAADAQHLATECTIRFIKDRAPIAALALTTDTSALTAAGNDLGYDSVFSRQVEALVRPQDLVIAISTSGRSPNVVKAVEAARRIGAKTVSLTGSGGGVLQELSDVCLAVPSKVTARIQETHILLGHILCAGLEAELGLAG